MMAGGQPEGDAASCGTIMLREKCRRWEGGWGGRGGGGDGGGGGRGGWCVVWDQVGGRWCGRGAGGRGGTLLCAGLRCCMPSDGGSCTCQVPKGGMRMHALCSRHANVRRVLVLGAFGQPALVLGPCCRPVLECSYARYARGLAFLPACWFLLGLACFSLSPLTSPPPSPPTHPTPDPMCPLPPQLLPPLHARAGPARHLPAELARPARPPGAPERRRARYSPQARCSQAQRAAAATAGERGPVIPPAQRPATLQPAGGVSPRYSRYSPRPLPPHPPYPGPHRPRHG